MIIFIEILQWILQTFLSRKGLKIHLEVIHLDQNNSGQGQRGDFTSKIVSFPSATLEPSVWVHFSSSHLKVNPKGTASLQPGRMLSSKQHCFQLPSALCMQMEKKVNTKKPKGRMRCVEGGEKGERKTRG